MRRTIVLFAVIAAALCSCSLAEASPFIRYGIQDDAWLSVRPRHGQRPPRPSRRARRRRRPGDDRLARGRVPQGDVRLVALRHDAGGAARAGDRATGHALGHPRLGERRPRAELGAHLEVDVRSVRAARRAAVPVRAPLGVWNEPNQQRWLRPDVAARLHADVAQPGVRGDPRVSPGSQVAGGVTAPRGSAGGVSPVDWIHGMAAAHAWLDAYAHNPYPLRPGDTPWRRPRPLHDDHHGHARPAARERGAVVRRREGGSG